MAHISAFTIKWKSRQSQGTWHAQDDYEHKGYSKEKTVTGEYTVVTKCKSTAKAIFKDKFSHLIDGGAELEIVSVKEAPVDLVVQEYWQ